MGEARRGDSLWVETRGRDRDPGDRERRRCVAADVAGFAFLAAWSAAPVATDAVGVGIAFHGGFVCGLIATLVVWATRGSLDATARRVVAVACGAVFAGGAAFMNIGVVVAPWSAVLTAAAGCATAYISYRWIDRLCGLSIKDGLVTLLVGLCASSFVRLFFFMVAGREALSNIALTALCGVASIVLLAVPKSGRASSGEAGERARVTPPQAPIALLAGTVVETIGRPALLEIAFYGMVMGLLRIDLVALLGASGMMAVGSVVKAVIMLALCANVVLVGRRHGRDGRSTHVFLACCALAALAFVFFGTSRQASIALVASALSFLVVALVYMRVIDVVGRCGRPTAVVFCTLRLAFETAILLGLVVRGVVVADGAEAWTSATPGAVRDTLCFAVSSMAVLLLLSMTGIAAPEPRASVEKQNGHIDLDGRCAKVAQAGNLTEREAQILGLICEGLTNRQIGERIFLTEATVRYHTKHFYKKLGVHNRQELVTLVLSGGA